MPPAELIQFGSAPSKNTSHLGSSSSKKLCVLVIDDDALVRRTLFAMLKALDTMALFADGGAAGLLLFQEHREEIDAVVLDFVMPEMTGDEVLVQLKTLSPSIPVLMISGNVDLAKTAEFFGFTRWISGQAFFATFFSTSIANHFA
ncbi:MAG: response regulator [Deltaproteobacteria bacterium]|nr:response regulator [Deltaproteobacteria bacterium]